ERKNGSDLDVFEGLSKKAPVEDEAPTPFMPMTGNKPAPLARHKTLLGMPNPPPGPPGRSSGLPPPPGATPSGKAFAPPLPGGPTPPPPPGPRRNSGLTPPTGVDAIGASPTGRPGIGSPGAAPPVPGPRPLANSADVEMDWDEDDEKTSVFERSDATAVFD